MHFSQHGTYSIEQRKNILIVDAAGPFNEEFIQAYKVDLEKHLSKLKNQCWAQMMTLHGLSLLTPEAEKALIFSLKLLRERGLAATAIIPRSSFLIVKEHISRVYSLAGVRHGFFERESQAHDWLRNVLSEGVK
ncbi:hypothetical protein [Alteromonas flava]|uniref:hypothetical protein n=1 Tax=Alteromonas flava TaxID=2048003 RepID=UPI000C28C713|nr:hypothetical protein [Alteromonas flava]